MKTLIMLNLAKSTYDFHWFWAFTYFVLDFNCPNDGSFTIQSVCHEFFTKPCAAFQLKLEWPLPSYSSQRSVVLESYVKPSKCCWTGSRTNHKQLSKYTESRKMDGQEPPCLEYMFYFYVNIAVCCIFLFYFIVITCTSRWKWHEWCKAIVGLDCIHSKLLTVMLTFHWKSPIAFFHNVLKQSHLN
jgi:hypothetical protein